MAQTVGEQSISALKTLIRYNIPTLILGVSSIGKSFTIISLAKKYRVKHQLLYIGSEKPENIEGLPKLHSQEEKLEYFKPYWFPKSSEVNKIVADGRALVNDFLKDFYKGDFEYSYPKLNTLLEGFSAITWSQTQKEQSVKVIDYANSKMGEIKTLNDKEFMVRREIPKGDDKPYKDDVRDICAYLCTLLGYGNFWLVLDEIDKIEEFDIDKQAPLLHIVRERYLKGWNLVEINDTKGINVPSMVKGGDYKTIKLIIDNSIENGQSLLDTRVIAIANKTSNLEEALFRRFVQFIIKDVLILDSSKITPAMSELKSCLTKVGAMGDALATPPMKQLPEVNLQWVFDFFIRMTNKNDLEGNYLYNDALLAVAEIREPKNSPTFATQRSKALRTTALWKIITDNFEEEQMQQNIIECLASIMFPSGEEKSKGTKEETLQDRARNHINELMSQVGDAALVSDEIIRLVGEQYPAKSQQAGVRAAITTAWIDTCQSYLAASIYDDQGKTNPNEVLGFLIPKMQLLINEKITADAELAEDGVLAVYKHASAFWEKAYDLNLKGDAKSAKAVIGKLYEGNDPLYVKFANKSDHSLISYIVNEINKGKENAIVADTEFYQYIKDNFTPSIKKYIPGIQKKVPAVAEKLKSMFL